MGVKYDAVLLTQSAETGIIAKAEFRFGEKAIRKFVVGEGSNQRAQKILPIDDKVGLGVREISLTFTTN